MTPRMRMGAVPDLEALALDRATMGEVDDLVDAPWAEPEGEDDGGPPVDGDGADLAVEEGT